MVRLQIFYFIPFIPFIEVNKETFGDDFYPPDLVSSNLEKKAAARTAVINVAKIICKENKKRLTNNLENVIKFWSSDKEFFVCGEKHNNYKDNRIILNWNL